MKALALTAAAVAFAVTFRLSATQALFPLVQQGRLDEAVVVSSATPFGELDGAVTSSKEDAAFSSFTTAPRARDTPSLTVSGCVSRARRRVSDPLPSHASSTFSFFPWFFKLLGHALRTCYSLTDSTHDGSGR